MLGAKHRMAWIGVHAVVLAACGDAGTDLEEDPGASTPGSSISVDGSVGSEAGANPASIASDAGPRLDAGQHPAGDSADAGRADGGMRPDAANNGFDGAMANPSEAGLAADAGGSDGGPGPVDPSTCSVQPIPDALRQSYKMGAIYKRYADANGIPVVASEKPVDEAIRRACLLVVDYTSVSAKLRQVMLDRKVRFIMMAKTEKTVDFPEYASLGDIDQRARGLGGVTDGICAEENVMCDRTRDRWRGESICVHEYAHTMHLGGYSRADPTFNMRLDAAFKAALAAGKYANTYAASQTAEYFAEGVQDWYNTNLQSAQPNGVHNFVNTRAELKEYDPMLYALLAEVLPDKPSYRDCYYYE